MLVGPMIAGHDAATADAADGHLWHRSLARRRSRAIAAFAVGYGAVGWRSGIVLTAMGSCSRR